MFAAQRQTYNKRAAHSRFAFNAHRSAMQLHQFLHQRQTDSAALMSAAAGIFDAMEAVKQARNFFRGDSYTGVAHTEFNVPICLGERDCYLSVERKFESVRNKIENNL